MAVAGYHQHLACRVFVSEGLVEKGAEAVPLRVHEVLPHRQEADGLERLAESSERLDSAFHPFWGSLFKQGTSKTRFAGQLDSYACLYTARARNFAFYGSQHYYRVARDPMMHELEDPVSGS